MTDNTAEAFAERFRRSANDEPRIVQMIQGHLGSDTDVTAKHIKAFLYGAQTSALSAYTDAAKLYAPAITVANTMFELLEAGMQATSDLNALSVFQDAIDAFKRERAQQKMRHAAVHTVMLEQKWGVSERLFVNGDQPTDAEIEEIAVFGMRHMLPLFMMIATYGVDGALKIMTPGTDPKTVTPLEETLPQLPTADFARVLIYGASTEYNMMTEDRVADLIQPPAATAVNDAMGDLMSRLVRKDSHEPLQPPSED